MIVHDAWIVYGGVLKRLDIPTQSRLNPSIFRGEQFDFVGSYTDYQEARDAWKAASFKNVDNALMRFFIWGFVESPIWTDEMFAKARPMREVVPFNLNPLDF